MGIIFTADGFLNSYVLKSPSVRLDKEANKLAALPDMAKNGVNPVWSENLLKRCVQMGEKTRF